MLLRASPTCLPTPSHALFSLDALFSLVGVRARCKVALLETMEGHVLELSNHMYGCRVVQKALETMDLALLVPVVREFRGSVVECVADQNGNHVVQKCVEVMSKGGMDAHIQFIVDAFEGKCRDLAKHPYGCRVVQRVLEHCVDAQRFAVSLTEGPTFRGQRVRGRACSFPPPPSFSSEQPLFVSPPPGTVAGAGRTHGRPSGGCARRPHPRSVRQLRHPAHHPVRTVGAHPS